MEHRDKQCAVCGVKQSLENSSLNDSGSYRSRCNACRSAQNKRRGETTEGFFTKRHSDLKVRHKRNNYKGDAITRDELIDLYKAQDGMCAISGLPMHTTTKNTDSLITEGSQKDGHLTSSKVESESLVAQEAEVLARLRASVAVQMGADASGVGRVGSFVELAAEDVLEES